MVSYYSLTVPSCNLVSVKQIYLQISKIQRDSDFIVGGKPQQNHWTGRQCEQSVLISQCSVSQYTHYIKQYNAYRTLFLIFLMLLEAFLCAVVMKISVKVDAVAAWRVILSFFLCGVVEADSDTVFCLITIFRSWNMTVQGCSEHALYINESELWASGLATERTDWSGKGSWVLCYSLMTRIRTGTKNAIIFGFSTVSYC